ncbi:MAG: putative siderophore transport system ATP-binding protein YusV [Verrucomicrobiae bacterium]|nr:putative siderophore transport system ATP-binding protein YusV [Verrucomicrobiae bacterium]
MNAVVCQNVNAGYRDLGVLHDVSLTIAEGQMMALLGPNGAGKSTLLRVLTGLHPHQTGDVRLFDRDVRHLPANERAQLVAVVPQEVTTPMAFTVEEMVKLGRWARRDTADIEPALTATDTLALRDRLYTELSGGEKQRVIIAMALAQEPKLLLLDEPTAHLDINHRLEILVLLEKLNRERGLTVLMTSHDLNLAAEFFPQLVLMNHGRIVAAGKPEEVFQEARLAEVFHCQLLVRPGPTGAITVTPKR